MRVKIYYTVVEVNMPEWETGSITDLESYDDINKALAVRNKLQDNDADGWYEVIVHEITR